jgi:hypothetical protein
VIELSVRFETNEILVEDEVDFESTSSIVGPSSELEFA